MSKLVEHAPAQGRRRIHSRTIAIEGFLRADGLLDLEARLVDTKELDYSIASGVRPAGAPIHEMRVVVTVDEQLCVRAVAAESLAVPYPGACESICEAYASLVGLNLVDGFRRAVQARLGGIAGCSHLTELLLSVPTVGLQTLASFVADNAPTQNQPFQLDKCHALDTEGAVVKTHYPRWYRER